MGKGKDSPRKSSPRSGKSKKKLSPPSTPTPSIKERELVPYFAADDPEGNVGHCVLPAPSKRGPKTPKSTRGNLRSPGKNKNKSNPPVSTLDERLFYAGPAFVNSPDPETLPHPSFLFNSTPVPTPETTPAAVLTQQPTTATTVLDQCHYPTTMDATTHLKLLLKLPVA